MQPDLFQLTAELELKHWWFTARRRILKALVRRILPPARNALVVDVGCGTGANLAALAELYTCIGIDPSETAIRLARERFPAVDFRVGSGLGDLPVSGQRADLFLLLDVLEHVADDFELFSEIAAEARPGARILLTVPADPSLWSVHDVSHDHYRRYQPERLRMVWQGLPVRVRMLSHFNARLYPLVRMVRLAGRWTGRQLGAQKTDLRLPPGPLNRLLEEIFAGEASRLVDLLEGRRASGYRRGVSLVAILEREQGRLERRSRPADLPPVEIPA